MPTLINRKNLRQALKHWDNSQQLGAHPLAQLHLVETRRQSAGYGETAIGYGVALRDVLLEALRALRPVDQTLDLADKRWRPYLILTGQYVDGRSPDYLIEQMSVARSTYDHEQAAAFESLASILQEWEQTPKAAAASEPQPEHSAESDLETILTVLDSLSEQSLATELVRSVNTFFALFESRGSLTALEPHLQHAEVAARKSGDRTGLSETLGNLGRAAQSRGDFAQAEIHYGEALELGRAASALPDQIAALLQGLGTIAFKRGDYAKAESFYSEALSLSRQHDLRDRLSGLLANVGALQLTRGNVAQAETSFVEGLTLARALGNRARVGALLINLGVLAARQHNLEQADACFQESLELARGAKNREQTVFLLTNLGTLANDRKDSAQADSYFHEALALARDLNDRVRISHLLANLGALANKRKDLAQAESYYAEGLSLARAVGHKENLILLLVNFGDLEKDQKALDKASEYYQEAMVLAKEIGHQRYETLLESKLTTIKLK